MAEKKGKSAFFSEDAFDNKIEQAVDAPTADQERYVIKPNIVYGQTQGKKGHKLPSMNMRFSPENYEWMRKQAPLNGMSVSQFVNAILEKERTR